VSLSVSLDPELAERLRAAGVDPATPGDPGEAWRSLHRRFGLRASLLDRYALEAAARGIPVAELDRELKARVTLEVLAAHEPGFELVEGSDRLDDDPIEVVDYDPSWPERFQTWRARLADALDATATRIEHVGSTSVPGLAAKPVIDVQISVPDLTDEAAYVPAIEAAGVAFRARDAEHRYFRPGANRPRDVQVHVCQAGSQWERQHLLFRDFLRADDATRDAYARLKRDLAGRFRDDRIAYNQAKTNFILDTMDRAETWAAGHD
jgi:GrpB-like predicted nucleotidyltransferase (UPF0157 family)